MTKSDLRLIKPSIEHKVSYFSYIDELGTEERYPMPMDLPHEDFEHLVQTLKNYESGVDLPDGIIANSTFWLMCGDEIVGVSNIRHKLNEALKRAGGHIGLGIRPNYRAKGLGKILLQYSIVEAKKLGIELIHIHCHADNLPSARMIEACGGVLSSTTESPNAYCRYIIDTNTKI